MMSDNKRALFRFFLTFQILQTSPGVKTFSMFKTVPQKWQLGHSESTLYVKDHDESMRLRSTVHTGFTLCLPENNQEHFHL